MLRSDRVVKALPAAQGPIQALKVESPVVAGMKLLLVGSLRPLHMAVQLGRVGRQHDETDAPLGTGLLELGQVSFPVEALHPVQPYPS